MRLSFFSRFRTGLPQKLSREQVDRLLASSLLLGIMGTLPEPPLNSWSVPNLLLVLSWILLALLTLTTVWAPSLLVPMFLLSLANLFLFYVKTSIWDPSVMLGIWGLWFYFKLKNRGKV